MNNLLLAFLLTPIMKNLLRDFYMNLRNGDANYYTLKKYSLSLFFFFWVITLFSQGDTKNTTIVDTNHIIIPDIIASDTVYAKRLLEEARKLRTDRNHLLDAFNKADTAFIIYKNTIGYKTNEVTSCQDIKAFVFTRREDHKKAELLYLENLNILTEIHGKNHVNITPTLHNLANCYRRNGSNDEAIDCLNKVLEIRQEAFGEFDYGLVSPLTSLAQSYILKIEHNKALNYLQKALNVLLNTHEEKNAHLINTVYNAFASCYSHLNDYDLSIEFYEKALSNHLENISSELNPVVASYYDQIGNNFARKGFYEKTLQYQQRALAIRERIFRPGHLEIAISFENIGNTYNAIGYYDKALEYQLNALQLKLLLFGPAHPQIVNSYNSIGQCYFNKEDLGRSMSYFEKSLNIIRIIHGQIGSPLAIDPCGGLGNCLFKKELYAEAREHYETANNILLNLPTPDSLESAKNLFRIGLCYFGQGNYSKALECQFKVLNTYFNLNSQEQISYSHCYSAIGDIYYKQGKYYNTIEYYFKALKIKSEMLGESHPLAIQIMKKMVYAYRQMNFPDSAQLFTERALNAIREQNASSIAAETQSLYQSQNLPILENTIDLAISRSEENSDINLMHNTFTYSEMAKAILLQSHVRQNEALAFSGIPDSLINKEKDIRLTINYREKQRRDLIEAGKFDTDSTVLRISSIIFDLKREQEELIVHFEKEYPDYYRLRYDLSTISLGETQENLLQSNQSLLEYFVGDSSIYVMVVTKDTFAVQGIRKNFPLDSLVQQLRMGIYGYYGMAIDDQTDELYRTTVNLYSDAATELYNKLIQPVSSLLTKDVIIVPDGVLGYVPFEILLKNEPTKIGQFQNYSYLFKDHNVSYSYSATLLKVMKEKKHKNQPEKSILALAPFYTGSYEMLDSTINLVFDTLSDGRDTAIFEKVVMRKSFSQLPSSGEEVTRAAKIWDGDYYINQDASRQNFIEKAGDYQILHLATHGTADAKDGKYSYLVFADTQDSIENEFLYVRDLYNMSLNADLVVLSACETAVGELQRGEGIVSLARGFAYAGAKSILTTLWVVDDTATKDLLRDFYINLRKGQDKKVAIHNAKVNYLRKAKSRYRHPFFWAGFIGIGDMSKIGE